MINAMRYRCSALLAWIVLGGACGLSSLVVADDATRPMGVLSIAGVDRLMTDVAYLTRVVGRPEVAGIMQVAGASFLEHVDRDRPAGILITIDDTDEPKGVGFLPIPDADKLLRFLRDRLRIEVEDLGGGVKKLEVGKGAYIRQQGRWLYFSDYPRHLARLPDDPQQLLQGLEAEYDVAMRLFVQHIPARLRDVAAYHLHTQIDAEFSPAKLRESGMDAEMAAAVPKSLKDAVSAVLNQSDQLTIGWGVDSAGRRVFLDVTAQGVEGSSVARTLTAVAGERTGSGRFMLADAAASFQGSAALSPLAAERLQAVVELVRRRVIRDIDQEPSAPQAIKPIVDKVLDVVRRTVGQAELDWGATIVLAPQSFTFVGGTGVADGPALADAFQQLFELAQHDPEVPQVSFFAERHRDVDLHRFTVPIPPEDQDARKILGDHLDVAIGTEQQYVYVAFGRDGDSVLKRIIDQARDRKDRAVAPLQLHVALQPILKFLAAIDTNDPKLGRLVQAASQARGGTDILLTILPVERGLTCRLELQEGVIELVGKASQDAAD